MCNSKPTVLITGGAVRIGASLVRFLAQHDFQIILHYHRSETEALNLFNEIGGTYCGHTLVRADLAQPNELSILDSLHWDILINNASLYHLNGESDEVERIMWQVNYHTPCALIEKMKNGVVINLLDAELHLNQNFSSSYESSKQALAHATLSLAREQAPLIRINGIALGPVLPPTHIPSANMTQYIARLPIQKAIPLEDICDSILFLIRQTTITGQILYLDGGLHLTQS